MEDLHNEILVENHEEESEDEVSLFERLPDELIISHVFDKISEAKFLCRCSLVSKHFASMVYQSKSLSIKIPLGIPNEELNPTSHLLSLPRKLLHFVIAPLRLVYGLLFRRFITLQRSRQRSIDSIALEQGFFINKVAKFLAKFESMRSLYLEFDYSGKPTFKNEPLVKWRIDSKSGCCILLMARSLDLATDNDDDDDEEVNIINMDTADFELIWDCFCYQLVDACFRFSLMEKLVPYWAESLQKVVVTDSKKQGKLDLEEFALLQLRNRNTNLGDIEAYIRFWHEPVLKLPMSGCVMKMVTLVICKDFENDDDDFLMVEEAFDGEEEVFIEAIMEMLKKDEVFARILEL